MKPEEITKYMGAVGQGVKNLALELKQPADQVYGMFLRQNYVRGIIGIVQISIILILTVYFIQLFRWGMAVGKDKYEDQQTRFDQRGNEWIAFVSVIWGCMLVVFWLIIIFGGFEEVLSRFINPNYMTIKDIISLVTPK